MTVMPSSMTTMVVIQRITVASSGTTAEGSVSKMSLITMILAVAHQMTIKRIMATSVRGTEDIVSKPAEMWLPRISKAVTKQKKARKIAEVSGLAKKGLSRKMIVILAVEMLDLTIVGKLVVSSRIEVTVKRKLSFLLPLILSVTDRKAAHRIAAISVLKTRGCNRRVLTRIIVGRTIAVAVMKTRGCNRRVLMRIIVGRIIAVAVIMRILTLETDGMAVRSFGRRLYTVSRRKTAVAYDVSLRTEAREGKRTELHERQQGRRSERATREDSESLLPGEPRSQNPQRSPTARLPQKEEVEGEVETMLVRAVSSQATRSQLAKAKAVLAKAKGDQWTENGGRR